MKKIIFFFLFLLLMATACDKNDQMPYQATRDRLIGTWAEIKQGAYSQYHLQFLFTPEGLVSQRFSYNDDEWNFTYELIADDSIKTERTFENGDVITTFHKLVFHSTDTLEISQFVLTVIEFGVEDITLRRVD